MLPKEFGELLAQLERAELPYVVIGGVAVNLLGYERATRDVDVLVAATPDIGRMVGELLRGLGATRVDGSELPDWLFDGEHYIRALTRHGIIDFIPEGLPPVSFAEVLASARDDELHGVVIKRADLAHLVALKRLAGRPQDVEDLEQLRAAYGDLPLLPLPGVNG